jgi:hypothetical protein
LPLPIFHQTVPLFLPSLVVTPSQLTTIPAELISENQQEQEMPNVQIDEHVQLDGQEEQPPQADVQEPQPDQENTQLRRSHRARRSATLQETAKSMTAKSVIDKLQTVVAR